jgi:hypothetical protein
VFGLFFNPEVGKKLLLRNVDLLQRNAQCYIPEDRTPLIHRSEIIQSYLWLEMFSSRQFSRLTLRNVTFVVVVVVVVVVVIVIVIIIIIIIGKRELSSHSLSYEILSDCIWFSLL